MKLSDLQYAPDLALPVPTVMFRVQRLRQRKGTVATGHFRTPGRGVALNRFDLSTDEVGYCAEAAETAIYESLARREALVLSLSLVATRCLLVLQTTRSLRLLDLRSHATHFPVLQSLRTHVTRDIAQQARAVGYQGIVYRSAQQYGADCYALFGATMAAFRLISKFPLIDPHSGALHRAVAAALLGSQVPVAE